jgi:hypothetical protein
MVSPSALPYRAKNSAQRALKPTHPLAPNIWGNHQTSRTLVFINKQIIIFK